MTLQLAVSTRNERLNSIQTEIGTIPILKIFTGLPPSDCSASDTETVLVSITLPSVWMSNAVNGSVSKSGTWQGDAIESGTAGHFRIYDSGETSCHAQGTVSLTGNGGDMEIDSLSITSGQTVIIISFSLTDGNS